MIQTEQHYAEIYRSFCLQNGDYQPTPESEDFLVDYLVQHEDGICNDETLSRGIAALAAKE